MNRYEELKTEILNDNDSGWSIKDRKEKLDWIIERAKHYGDKLNINWKEIINSWEEDRNYWYMNYYQDCNQPLLDDNVKIFETVDDFRKSVGDKGFRCPCCNGVSSNPYECDSGLEMAKGKICDWKSYGLFGTLGKGIHVFVKEKLKGETIFMPISWEESNE